MKKNLNLKKRISALVFAVVSAFLCFSGAASKDELSAFCSNTSNRKLQIYRVERDDKTISISFDCAWGNEYTEKILDYMDEYGVKCTFFAVSFWVEKYPDDVKNIISRGHEMGTHSKTHSYMSKLSKEKIVEELEYSCKKIEEVSGKKPLLFRPPYGDYNDLLIETAAELGLYAIQWDVDSLDWKEYGAQDMLKRVLEHKNLKPGAILLFHNNTKYTAQALDGILVGLEEMGYSIGTVSELVLRDNYGIDAEGRQYSLS